MLTRTNIKKKNLFAWASIAENGTANGKVGDSTKNEVKVGYYYDFGQTHCIRLKSPSIRKKVAVVAKYLAKDDRTGYSKKDRTNLFKQCANLGWDFEKIKKSLKPTNCDCSQFYAVCVNIAYGKEILSKDVYTGNLIDICKRKKKMFNVLNIRKAESKFKKGDAPIKEFNHIIINV